MRVYALNPPFKANFVRTGRWQGVTARGGTMYYPIWLAYTTGLLEKEGHSVRLVDAVAAGWGLERVVKDATEFRPDLIIAESNFSSMRNDATVLRTLHDRTGAFTLLCGPPASQYPKELLDAGVNAVARYEYEFIARDLAHALESKQQLSSVRGISYLDGGKMVSTPDRGFSTDEDLDSLPFVSEVYKEHLSPEQYFLNHALYPMVQIITGRGCPNQCTFCSWPETLTGRKYRQRSVDSIIAEFKYIEAELPQVKEVFIEDDTFTINKKRAVEFSTRHREEGIRLKWGCQSRATLDLETMRAMRAGGCRLLDVGFESGSDTILKNIKKGLTTEDLRKFAKDAKKARLKVLADFVIGFTGETKETAEETLRFIKEIRPDILQVAVATPMPGTAYREWCVNNGYLLTDDMESSVDEDGFQKCIVSYPWLGKEEIEGYVDKALKHYYLSPSYLPILIKNLFSSNPMHEMKVLLYSAKGFLDYMGRMS